MKCPVVVYRVKLTNGVEDTIHRTFLIPYLNYFHIFWYPKDVKIKEIILDTVKEPRGCLYLINYDEDYKCGYKEVIQDINLSIDLLNKIKKVKAKALSDNVKLSISDNVKELKKLLIKNETVEDTTPEVCYRGISPYILGTRC